MEQRAKTHPKRKLTRQSSLLSEQSQSLSSIETQTIINISDDDVWYEDHRKTNAKEFCDSICTEENELEKLEDDDDGFLKVRSVSCDPGSLQRFANEVYHGDNSDSMSVGSGKNHHLKKLKTNAHTFKDQ